MLERPIENAEDLSRQTEVQTHSLKNYMKYQKYVI
jgi:hypothetical protein